MSDTLFSNSAHEAVVSPVTARSIIEMIENLSSQRDLASKEHKIAIATAQYLEYKVGRIEDAIKVLYHLMTVYDDTNK